MDYKLIGTIYAPVEYDGPDMLKTFNITKDDLIPYVVGTKRILIFPYPAPEDVCKDMLLELRRKYSKRSREERCLVPGKSGRLIVCPEENRCSACPFGRDERYPRVSSLDEMKDNGVEVEAPGTDMLDQLIRDVFMDHLRSVDPHLADILDMKDEGLSVAEIARREGVSYHVIRYQFDKIKALAAEFLGV